MQKPEDIDMVDRCKYACNGFWEIAKNEFSFKMQLLFFVLLNIVAWSLPLGFVHHAILSLSLFIPVIAEIFNSAVERAVDLVTSQYHPMAKYAKDAAAAGVLFSIILTAGIWIAVLLAGFHIIS
jgi:diacylglycerol kinase (ATP)